MRKRVIAFGLILGLAVNQMILYQLRAVSADNSVIPMHIMNDIQKNVGYNNDSYESQKQQIIPSNTLKINQQSQVPNYQEQYTGNYDPNRPEWKDFAPYGWDKVTLDPKEGTYWTTEKINKATARRYWYERRQDFEKDLAQCDRLQKDYKYACYEKLKIRQANINEQKKQKEQEEFVKQMRMAQVAQQISASAQAAARAAEERNFQREQMNQQMMINYFQNSPFRQQPKYQFYDRYGRPQGYVQQTNW